MLTCTDGHDPTAAATVQHQLSVTLQQWCHRLLRTWRLHHTNWIWPQYRWDQLKVCGLNRCYRVAIVDKVCCSTVRFYRIMSLPSSSLCVYIIVTSWYDTVSGPLRVLHLLHLTATSDRPAAAGSDHIHDPAGSASHSGGEPFLWGADQCPACHQPWPLRWPEGPPPESPAPISWPHHLRITCCPQQPGGERPAQRADYSSVRIITAWRL